MEGSLNPATPGVSCGNRGRLAIIGFGNPQPELLSPAGDWACAKAAVENGADAIYFGLNKFNARMRADNFTEADLPKLMEFLHRRGVRGYLTLNTLVFENELADVRQYLHTMITAGVDAVIVQDVGLCRMIRELSPDFPIHASTQMTITSAAGVEFAQELGCQLVVLARELSIKEIEAVQSGFHNPQSSIPLEVFVHGALCVAYSGQCLTSESLGGRSANRGECAQACRMPYDMIADGKPVSLGDRRYLLSPQDLAGIDLLPELVRAGVASFKIEGRLKAPAYVANITRIYRQSLDALVTQSPERGTGKDAVAGSSVPRSALRTSRYEMEMAFSRGLYTGWFGGVNNQELVHGRFGKKRGVFLGEVTAVYRDSVSVRLKGPLKPGDGVVFDAGRPEEREEGGRVFEVRTAELGARDKGKRAPLDATRTAQHVFLTFGNGAIDFKRIHVGNRLWKTSDPALEKKWRQSFEGDRPRFQRALKLEIHGLPERPLTMIARDERGHVAQAQSIVPLLKADKQPLSTERLREQLGRLGGTPFRLGDLDNHIEGDAILPLSELNRLRREVVAKLERQRAQPKRWALHVGQASCPSANPGTNIAQPENPSGAGETHFVTGHFGFQLQQDAPTHAVSEAKLNSQTGKMPVLPSAASAQQTELIILVRNLPQLEAALRCGARTVYCDFENPKKYRDAVQTFRARQLADQGCGLEPDGSASRTSRSALYVAPPRVFKPGEDWQLEQVRSCNADGYLVRNYDHLRFFANDRCVGDFSLNIANHLSADFFLHRFGLERVTASYDLNFQQLEALLVASPPEWFEITIHQHMPMFHMEHCVFCAFLSKGKDYHDCGRPCDNHDVKLRDRVGAEHPVKADVGCRNTVFNAMAQTGAEYLARMLALGVRHFRIEFLNESPSEVEQTITRYRQLVQGEITGTQLWKELRLFSQLGVTRGTVK